MYPELKRKYGKYGYELFDHLSSHHASLGSGKIGKVEVDCRFRFKKSQWGVLGPTQCPAGIIYLDLNFDQPVDCRLKSATVTVTLEDESLGGESLESMKRRWGGDYNKTAHFAPWFGPQHLSGQSKYKLKTKRNQLTPHVEAMGLVGAGGVGKDSDETFIQESRWNFTGRLLSQDRSLVYRTIKWELTENDFETQPMHTNVIHTACSFQHSGQPFLIKVEVSGKLRSRDDRFKHRLKKFSSSLKKDESYATTLINFGAQYTFQKPLDELARGLKDAMEMENFETAPVLVPSTHKVLFREDRPAEEAPMGSQNHTDNRPGVDQRLENPLYGLSPEVLEERPSTLSHLLGEQEINGDNGGSLAPTLANLAGAFAELTAPELAPMPPKKPPLPGDQVEPIMDEAPKDVANIKTANIKTADIETADIKSNEDIHMNGQRRTKNRQEDLKPPNPQADIEEAILALLRLPGILLVVQLLVALLSSCGIKLASKERAIKGKMGLHKILQNEDGDTKSKTRSQQNTRIR